MPKAFAKVHVSTVTPSAQELSDARAHLQALTPTQVTSKKASLRQFLTKNPDVCTTNPAGAGSILEFFMYTFNAAASRKRSGCHKET